MTTYKLPELPYDFSALEPVISGEIMELHYTKHHQAYVNNLNIALEKYKEAESKGDVARQIELHAAIRFNGGGHVNHSLFWENLAPISHGGGGDPQGELKKKIELDFGSFAAFKETMSAQTVSIQGSGWGWLGFDKSSQRLRIASCSNQDPLSILGFVPLLGIDVWEHAYYLQYKNVRAKYVEAIWGVINWDCVGKRLSLACK